MPHETSLTDPADSGVRTSSSMRVSLTIAMSYILAVQPDPAQAGVLRHALHERGEGELVVVDSVHAALAAIDKDVPDVILLHQLAPPDAEDYLIAYLRIKPDAGHVQTIVIPTLQTSSESPELRTRSWLLGLKQPPFRNPRGCESQAFVRDVVSYLARARAVKEEMSFRTVDNDRLHGPDRRGERRRSPLEVPWVSSVQLAAGGRADLVNVSSGGALVRTRFRPGQPSLMRLDPDARRRSGVTFQLVSGEEIRAMGTVVRCQLRPTQHPGILYDVAFRFDEAVGLHLPTRALPAGTGSNETSLVYVGGSAKYHAPRIRG
jgi:CheY-like chemotaxis protein